MCPDKNKIYFFQSSLALGVGMLHNSGQLDISRTMLGISEIFSYRYKHLLLVPSFFFWCELEMGGYRQNSHFATMRIKATC